MDSQKTANERHRKFVDFMHPHFGLEKHPGYCDIVVRPLLIMGGFNPPNKIMFSDSFSFPEQTEFTIWHESAHFIHYTINPQVYEEIRETKEYSNWTRLAEVVADLGALVYLGSFKELGPETFDKYDVNINPSRMNACLYPEDVLAIMNISMSDKNLLRKLAVAENWEKARKLMEMHYEETTAYLNSICRLGLEVSQRDLIRLESKI